MVKNKFQYFYYKKYFNSEKVSNLLFSYHDAYVPDLRAIITFNTHFLRTKAQLSKLKRNYEPTNPFSNTKKGPGEPSPGPL
ncbi:hypothetical protein DZB84_09055 [Bacillus sp. HNG]|nr:hypothetical protein DZB84_09055 [Bacillus sp. HNG]